MCYISFPSLSLILLDFQFNPILPPMKSMNSAHFAEHCLSFKNFPKNLLQAWIKIWLQIPPPKPCTKTYHGNRGVGHTARGTEAAPPPCNGWFRGPMLNVAFAGNEKESIIHVGTLHRLQERRQEPVSLTFPCWLWQRFKRLTIFSSNMTWWAEQAKRWHLFELDRSVSLLKFPSSYLPVKMARLH